MLFLLLASACSALEQAAEVDPLEIKLSGWSSLEVDVNDRGEGH
jgi:hypothetical protein